MIDSIAAALAIIGGLNWGVIGLFHFDVVAWIFGGQNSLGSRIIYTLVGIAALWQLYMVFRKSASVSGSESSSSQKSS